MKSPMRFSADWIPAYSSDAGFAKFNKSQKLRDVALICRSFFGALNILSKNAAKDVKICIKCGKSGNFPLNFKKPLLFFRICIIIIDEK